MENLRLAILLRISITSDGREGHGKKPPPAKALT
jgi:hypothetical protein